MDETDLSTAAVLKTLLVSDLVGSTALVERLADARAEREAERANREAAKARRVRDFLVELWRGAKPERSRGEEITARRLLDEGAESVDRDLADQPLLRADLTGTLGEIYYRLGDYDRAEALFTTSVELFRQHPGHDDAGLATGLMNLASVHASRGHVDQARPLLEEAAHGPDHPDVAKLRSEL